MIPPKFEYFAPTTVHEALTLLRQYGSEAKLLSGGQSLIPLMKLRGYPETLSLHRRKLMQHPCGNEIQGDRKEQVGSA